MEYENMRNRATEVAANIAKNRLHITIQGNLSKEDLNKLYTEIRFCVADLSSGFHVITDLSNCSIAALSGIPTFRKITNYLLMNKVGRVVRVIDSKRVILKQLINFTAKINGYKADLYHSLAEAEVALSDEERRDSLRFVLAEQSVDFRIGEKKSTGSVKDLSLTGCAIATTDELPAVSDQIFISMGFKKHEEIMEVLECKAEVVWAKDKSFGIKFTIADDKQKEQLWERLMYESNCGLPSP